MGCCGPLWACVGLRWLRWPLLATVCCCGPALAFGVDGGSPLGDGKPTLGSCLRARRVKLGVWDVRNENPPPPAQVCK